MENAYSAKHLWVPVNKLETVPSSNLVLSATASESYQSSFDRYDLSSDDEEYFTPNNVPETTPGQSDRAARLLTAARLYLNLPPKAPKNWGQIDPNLNDYHYHPMEISSTFWIPDITDWWRVVLATGPGTPPVVRVLSRSSVRFGSRTVQKPEPQCLAWFVAWTGHKPADFWRVVPGLRFDYTVPPKFAPIKYLSSDHIMTWSVRSLCCFSRSFTSRSQICDWTNICWFIVK